MRALRVKDMRLVFTGELEAGRDAEHNPLCATRFGLRGGPLARNL